MLRGYIYQGALLFGKYREILSSEILNFNLPSTGVVPIGTSPEGLIEY
jgi:hypothetical protein